MFDQNILSIINVISNSIGMLAALLALVTPIINYGREMNIKRKTVIESLINHKSVNDLINKVDKILYLSTLSLVIITVLYILFVYLLPFYFVYENALQSFVTTPIRNLDPKISLFLTIINLVLPCSGYMFYSLNVIICELRKRTKEHGHTLYKSKLILDYLFLISILNFIILFWIENSLSIPNAPNVKMNLISFTLLCFISLLVIWVYFYFTRRGLVHQIRDYLISSELSKFRDRLPHLKISTKSTETEGYIWNLFDSKTLILKTPSGSYIYIPWNEISWIEVIEREEQNDEISEENKPENPKEKSIGNELKEISHQQLGVAILLGVIFALAGFFGSITSNFAWWLYKETYPEKLVIAGYIASLIFFLIVFLLLGYAIKLIKTSKNNDLTNKKSENPKEPDKPVNKSKKEEN